MKYKIFVEFEFEPLDDATLIDEVAEILPTNADFTYENLKPSDNNDLKKVCPLCEGRKKIPDLSHSTIVDMDCPKCIGKPISKS